MSIIQLLTTKIMPTSPSFASSPPRIRRITHWVSDARLDAANIEPRLATILDLRPPYFKEATVKRTYRSRRRKTSI